MHQYLYFVKQVKCVPGAVIDGGGAGGRVRNRQLCVSSASFTYSLYLHYKVEGGREGEREGGREREREGEREREKERERERGRERERDREVRVAAEQS